MRISDWSSDVCSSDLQGGAAARHQYAEIGNAPRIGIAHGEADAVAALDAETVDQSRRDLPRRHIDLFERQPLVAFDQEGRIAVLRGEKGDIIREVDWKSTRLNSSH